MNILPQTIINKINEYCSEYLVIYFQDLKIGQIDVDVYNSFTDIMKLKYIIKTMNTNRGSKSGRSCFIFTFSEGYNSGYYHISAFYKNNVLQSFYVSSDFSYAHLWKNAYGEDIIESDVEEHKELRYYSNKNRAVYLSENKVIKTIDDKNTYIQKTINYIIKERSCDTKGGYFDIKFESNTKINRINILCKI